MPELLREATRTARKVHHCEMCGGLIKIGERHRVETCVYDGRVYDWRTCTGCNEDRITSTVWNYWCQPDEGVNIDSARDWADENRDLPEAKRWLDRNARRGAE